MGESGRILSEAVDINNDKVHSFFDNRVNKKLFHRYNLINYQDNNPTLALERDEQEKRKIRPFLSISENMRILDIGCGVGRWGDELVPELTGGIYVGVDYSEQLINIAREAAEETKTAEKRKYLVGSFQDLTDVLESNGVNEGFDLVIINGVLMYINDTDINNCMGGIGSLLNKKGMIYIKESVGINSRLTLKDIYSEELTSDYSAIYRSKNEYEDYFSRCLDELVLVAEGETFEDQNLHNRKETTSYFWIFCNQGQNRLADKVVL